MDTVFEAGSVSKQFTAAAVMLLARDGKLSLDDPVRKYIPELPDYGAPLTIRQMLTHTSGLRDWGAVVAAAGWPRGSRVHTHGHVLEVLSRQKALNFPSGTEYSYSNSGYNLAAILVSRVAGKPFAEFTRERIFVPLGMTRTEWRDDYTRIVKGRATAYSKDGDGLAHAPCPSRTSTATAACSPPSATCCAGTPPSTRARWPDAEFAAEEQRPGALSDGRPIRYAMGLSVDTWKGAREVSHGGATARLSRRPRPLSGSRPLGRRAVQRRQRERGRPAATRSPTSSSKAGSPADPRRPPVPRPPSRRAS